MSLPTPGRRAALGTALHLALAGVGVLALPVKAQQVFRVTTIPEEAATEQVRKFTPLASTWSARSA